MLQDLFGSQQTEGNDSADEALLEKLMQQETPLEQDKQSILAQVQEKQIDAERASTSWNAKIVSQNIQKGKKLSIYLNRKVKDHQER